VTLYTSEEVEKAESLLEAAHDHELLMRDLRIKQLEELNRILAARIDELEAEAKA
jgi:hypothetical protein